MAWPHPTDYNEAIQNPSQNFKDPDLRQGKATTNALGLLLPCSGNFADVYRVDNPAVGKSWAVKCFTKEVPGLQKRYQAISDHLQQAQQKGGLPFMVEFAYVDQGILIKGQWFPILKMQWVEGHALNTFVKDHLANPKMLLGLAQLWQRLAKELRAADMAHGDLQHGNVLLVPEKAGTVRPTLIDYDGMFVDALAKTKSGEVGHPNYQHPERLRDGIYNGEVDRFSHLVVYTSLHCLAVEGKALWDRYDNGDNLLFREQDFQEPATSPLFQELWKLKDDILRPLVGRLLLASQDALDQVALLDDLVGDGQVPLLTANQEKRIAKLLNAAGGRVRSVPKFVASSPGTATSPNRTPFPGKSAPSGTAPVPGKSGPIPFKQQGSYRSGGGGAQAIQTQTPLPKHTSKQPRSTPVLSSSPTFGEVFVMVFLKPMGIFKLWRHPDLTPQQKKAWTGGFVAYLGLVLVIFAVILAVASGPGGASNPNNKPDGSTQNNPPNQKTPLDNKGKGKPLFLEKADLRFEGHEGPITCVAWQSDGSFALSGSADKTIRFWNVKTGKQVSRVDVPSEVTSLAVSPSGKFFLTGSRDSNVRLWAMKTGQEVGRYPMAGHPTSVAFSADDGMALGASGGELRWWDLKTGKQLQRVLGLSSFTSVAFSPEGKVLVANDHLNISVRDPKTGQEEIAKLVDRPLGWECLNIVPTGTWALYGKPIGTGKGLMVWDWQTGKDYRQADPFRGLPLMWDSITGQEFGPSVVAKGQWEKLTTFSLAPDFASILAGGSDHIVRLYKLPKWQLPQEEKPSVLPQPQGLPMPQGLPPMGIGPPNGLLPPASLPPPSSNPKPPVEKAGPAIFSRAWVIQNPIDFIMAEHPLIVFQNNAKNCRLLDEKKTALVLAADGKMLEEGTYHVFEIPTKKALNLTWKGRATGTKQVHFSLWDGAKMKQYTINKYAGDPVPLVVAPAALENHAYLMVNCSRGSIATDCLILAEIAPNPVPK